MTDEKDNAKPSGASGGSMAWIPLGWISVRERLPRMGERVLIGHAADGWINVGERDVIGSYEYWSDDGEELGTPTHWMPLPAPPTDAK